MSASGNPIARVLEAYQAAVYEKDLDAFMALYDPEVRVFDTWGRWSYDGAARWREMVAEWFGSLGAEKVAVEVADLQTIVTPEIAVAHAFLTYRGLSATGDALRSMVNRLTWTLKPKDGMWRISHEHTSAPIDFITSKVILQR